MRKVITYGTFDLLHAGHIKLLRRAKELGDYLIVVVSTDEFNWNEKRKKCYFSYEERIKLVEAVRYVDLEIPEENWDQKISDVKEYHVDTFVMGDDWKGKFDFLKDYCDVVYLPRTEGISTTKNKQESFRQMHQKTCSTLYIQGLHQAWLLPEMEQMTILRQAAIRQPQELQMQLGQLIQRAMQQERQITELQMEQMPQTQ